MNRTLLTLTTTTAAVGVLGTALLTGPADAAAGKRPAAAGKTVPMAFESDRDGDGEVYAVDKHGRTTQLTRNAHYDGSPVWSPDGRRIAFVSDRDGDAEIFTMNADGSGVRQITRNSRAADGAPAHEGAPAWSPDGSRIAYASNVSGGETEVWVVRADGSRPTRLTRTEAFVSDHTPAWSPDGRHLVFASNRAGFEDFELYRMRSDGTDVRRLTRTADGTDENAPRYSPDGRRIAFSSTRSGQQGIWVMNADGTGARVVADAKDLDDVFPRWTRDGSRLVFWTFPREDGTRADIYSVRADGTDRRRLSTHPAVDALPDPHPERS